MMPLKFMMPLTETKTREGDTSGCRLNKTSAASLGLCFNNQALNLKSQPPIYTNLTFHLPKTKSKRTKKNKDSKQPQTQITKTKKTRSPSGYNIFFHMAREKIFQLQKDIKSRGHAALIEDISRYIEFNPCRIAKAAISLQNKSKRKHVKVQDSYLSFHELTRIVADSWKNLLPSIRAMFTAQADIEFDHHQQLEWKQNGIRSVENKCQMIEIPEIHTDHQSPHQLKTAKNKENIQRGCRSQGQSWKGYHDTVISYEHLEHEWINKKENMDPYSSGSIVLMMMEENEWQKTRMDQANQLLDNRNHTLINNDQADKVEVQTSEFTDFEMRLNHDWNVNEFIELNHTSLPIRHNRSCVDANGALGSYCFNPVQDDAILDLFSF